MSAWTHARARVAALTASRSPDDPDLLDARLSLAAARLGEWLYLELVRVETFADDVDQLAARAAAAMPPLSAIQSDALGKLVAALQGRSGAGDPPAMP